MDCGTPAAELGYRLKLIPGLLAQIHAIAPRLNPSAVAQLLCPVGRLAKRSTRRAGGAARGPVVTRIPDRRPEFGQLGPLLSDCQSTLRDRLGWPLP